MNIVHLICSFTTGGAELMLIDIINQQLKSGEDVSLVIINNQIDNRLISLLDKRVRLISIKRHPGSKNIIPLLILNYQLFQLKANVLHCHDSIIAGMLFPLFKSKLCLTVHTLDISSKYLNRYRKIISISESVQKDLSKRLKTVSYLVENGIKIESIKQKQTLMPAANSFKIVVIGRLEHHIKGQHILIKALYNIKKQTSMPIQIDFIGNGSSIMYLQSLVAQYDLTQFVHFKGLKNRNFIYEHLQDYNLLVQPSICEGFGLTVVEALVAKVPVLVSGKGPTEIVHNGQFGCVFKAGDINDCSEKLLWIISNYTKLEKMINDAAEYAIKNFSLSKMVNQYKKIYQQI